MTPETKSKVRFKTVIFTILGMVLLVFIAVTPDPRAIGLAGFFPIGLPVMLFGTPEYPEFLIPVPYVGYTALLILF